MRSTRCFAEWPAQDFRDVFAVADDDQTIYEWNGANVRRIGDLVRDFSCDVVQLPTNFRCPPRIVEAANRLVVYNAVRARAKQPARAAQTGLSLPEEQQIQFREFDTDRDEAVGIAGEIEPLDVEARGRAAVLARNRALLELTYSALAARGVRAEIVTRRDDFVSPQMRWLVACLKQIGRPLDRRNMAVVMQTFDSFATFPLDWEGLASRSESDDIIFLEAWITAVREAEGSQAASALVDVIADLAAGHIKLPAAIQTILEHLKNDDPDDDLKDDMNAWRRISREIRASGGLASLDRFAAGTSTAVQGTGSDAGNRHADHDSRREGPGIRHRVPDRARRTDPALLAQRKKREATAQLSKRSAVAVSSPLLVRGGAWFFLGRTDTGVTRRRRHVFLREMGCMADGRKDNRVRDDRMTTSDRRLIEDYLPVDWLSAEASGEPRTKGHISTLHLWRARRPLVACRAAIYSALVKAPGSAQERAHQDSFLKALCQWGAPESIMQQARRRIGEDRDSPPRVLDLFAGGGAIPLEALRLGCDAYALDLNPVAFLILKADLRIPAAIWPRLVRRGPHVGRAGSRASAHRHFGVLSEDSHSGRSRSVREGSSRPWRDVRRAAHAHAVRVPLGANRSLPEPAMQGRRPSLSPDLAAKETVRLCGTAPSAASQSRKGRFRRGRQFFGSRTRVRPSRGHARHGHALPVLRLCRFRHVCTQLRKPTRDSASSFSA